MKKVLLTILWMLAILMPSATWAQSSEAYAVLSESNTKLTFYYDENKASRSGMSVGPFTVSWNVDGTQSVTGREWESAISTITTVVFDDSFANCTTLTSIAGWFNDNRALVDIQGIENLKTDNVTDMSGVFYMCLSLTSLDLSSFKTDNVTNMAGMFPGCSGLTSLNISSFNTENVVYIGGMFYNCSSLTSLDVSGFKTANVTDMSNLFYGCSNLSSLDLRNFNTANATNMSNMFSGCSHLETIYVGGEWTTAAVTEGSSMFSGCDNLVGGEGTTYSSSHIDYAYAHIDGGTSNPGYFTDIADYGKVKEAYAVLSDENTKLTFYYDKKKTDRSGMDIGPFAFASDRGWNDYVETITTVVFNESFANCTTITSLERWFDHCSNLTLITGMSNLKTDNVTDMWALFEGCSSLTSIDLTHFNTENVTNMGYMFGGCSSLTSLDVSGFNTDNVTSMSLMFYGCSGLSDLNVSGFNTANVTNMNGMFRDCSGLSVLDLSNFNTANVTDMSQLFYGCSGLSNLNVTSFNTANVTTMKRMFDSCVSLTTLDLSSFKTDKVTDMDQMFNYCSNLTTIYVSSEWSTEALTHGSSVFANCSKLEGGSGTKYEYAAWDYTYAHIDGGTDNPGYLTDIADMGKVNEAYAVLSDENTKLTFYYDKKKSDRNGMGMGNYDGALVTVVTIDSSFANYYPESTSKWFEGFSMLTTINNIENLKTDSVTTMEGMFMGCYGLTSLDLSSFNTSNVTNMNSMFYWCTNLTSLDVSGFNTSNVTDMYSMFLGCSGLTSLDVSGFNTQKVMNMSQMFHGCSNLTSLDVSSFNMVNVTDMSNMFGYCSGLTSLDVSGFKTDNVTDMNQVFSGCSGLTSLNLTGLNTSNVTDMSDMFSGCSGLTSLDISGFNTVNVTNMNSMFRYCSSLTSLDVSGFNTANVTDMSVMFADCPGLTTIYAGGEWSTAMLSAGGGTFSNCSNLVGGEGTTYSLAHVNSDYARIDGGPENPGYFTDIADFGKVNEPYAVLSDENTKLTFYYDKKKTDRNGMDVGPFVASLGRAWNDNSSSITTVIFDSTFANDTTLTSTASWFSNFDNLTTITGIENLNTANVTDMSFMFDGCSSLTSLDVSGFNTSSVTDMSCMVRNCSGLTTLDLSGFNTVNVINMNSMFYGCSGLTSLALSGFNTANLMDMNYMFYGCSGLTSLDVSNFNTANVSSMLYVFWGCAGLTSLDLSSFNTANVMDMRYMFYGCSGLTSLDLSKFNTANVTNMMNMFEGCSSLATIYVGDEWRTTAVAAGAFMFAECSSLVGGEGTVYDADWQDVSYAHIDGGTSNPGYLTDIAYKGKVNEPYAALSDNSTSLNIPGVDIQYAKTLTFYYDKKKEERNGMDVNFTDNTQRGWSSSASYITEVVFDPSFANCTTLTSTAWLFWSMGNLTTITGIENLKTDSVTNMHMMFAYCSKLTSLDVSGFKTDKVIGMHGMFTGCSGLTSLDVSGFNTASATDMGYLFDGCSALTSLDVSSFNTENVTDMSYMFGHCSGLTTLDLSSFNTAKVTNMEQMFSSDIALTTIYVDGTKWNTAAVTSSTSMFSSCTKLVGGEGTTYENYHDDVTYAHIDGGPDNPGYLTEKSTLAAGDLFTAQTIEGVTLTYYVINPDQMTCGVANNNEKTYMDMETTGVVTIPAIVHGYSVITISDYAFKNCAGVTEFVLPESLQSIAQCAFRNCTSLTTVHIPANMTAIESLNGHPWAGCSSLTTITVDAANPVFDSRDNCNAIMVTAENTLRIGSKGVTIPESTVTIGHSAFDTMGELPALVIPASVQNIVAYAFWGCTYPSVTSYITEPFETSSVWGQMGEDCPLYVPAGTVEAYKSVSEWNNFSVITTIGSVEEAYAVLSADNTTLTFYYDLNKESRGGMSVGPFGSAGSRGWNGNASSITSVVFDSSFANDTTLTSTANWFFGMGNLTTITGIDNLKTDNVTSMLGMFQNCESLTSLDLSGFNTSKVESMVNMFYGCKNLTSIDMSHFNTASVTSMASMFYECQHLLSIDLSGFNTSSVTNMSEMFENCSALTTLDVTGFKTEIVTRMDAMFSGCAGLTTLDVSSFNTAQVTEMTRMFGYCTNLKTIYAGSGWSATQALGNSNGMFVDCTNLVGGAGTVYNPSYIDASYAHIDGGADNPGYFTLPLSLGDANGDGSINIADAVATVTNILGEPTEGNFYRYAADMNGDSTIDIFDVTMIVNAVFDASAPALAITRGGIDNVAEAIRLTADANSIYMDVDQAQQYTAFQFDMSLPESVGLVGVKLASDRTDHQVSFVQRGENEYCVVGLSMSNETLSSADGHLIELQVSNIAGESNVKVSNVLFVTPAGKTVTGIDELLNTTMATDGNIYNLKGEKLGKSMQQLGKGIYIMNHKKVIIK